MMNQDYYKLGDMATYINGYAFKPSDWGVEGVPIIRIQDLTGNSYQSNYFSGEIDSRFRVHHGDILISWSASLGIFEWQGGDAVLNQHIFKVIFDKKVVDKNFFVHQIRMLLERFANEAHGATMKHLTRPVFDALPFYAPPLARQKEISFILERVDKLMVISKRRLEMLDQLAKSRFIEMFGDPIENPKNWKTYSLSDFGQYKNGMNFRNGESGFQVHCLGVGDFQDHAYIRDAGILPMIDLNSPPDEAYLLHDEDIVFVRSNGNKALVGRCVAVYPGTKDTVYSGFCIRFRQTTKFMNTAYLLMVLKSSAMRKAMAGRGANIQNLNQQTLDALKIPAPPMELQNEFASFIEKLDKSKVTIQKSLDQLNLLYKALLQEHFG